MKEPDSDQATEYLRLLLKNFDGSPAEKFYLLRQISVTVAGDRTYREPIVSKAEVDSQMLKYYLERVEIDLVMYKDTISSHLTKEMMRMTHFGTARKLTKKQADARAKAVAKAMKKNIVLSDVGVSQMRIVGSCMKPLKRKVSTCSIPTGTTR